MSKHTSDPWTLESIPDLEDGENIEIYDSDGFPIAKIEGEPIINKWSERFPEMDHWSDGKEDGRTVKERPAAEILANARLISAAPELLAALEQIIEEFNPKRPEWHLMVSSEGQRLARAAVAKARGINTSNCAKCGAALSDDDAHPELCPACTPPAPEPRKGEYLIPAGARAGSCRSCGADVLWITTAKGSAMPLSVATIEERDGERYALSHFSDCPQGKGWSKKSR